MDTGLVMSQVASSDRVSELRSVSGDRTIAQAKDGGLARKKCKCKGNRANERPITCNGATEVTQTSESTTSDSNQQADWRLPLIDCIRNPGRVKDRKIR
jgi:hypothetical protein